MQPLELLLTLISTLGGLELIKFLLNRKIFSRKEEATVVSLERQNERDHIKYLEERLAERDSKIDTIYLELRKEQAEKLEILREKHTIELELREANVKKCVVRGCSGRKPPSEY